MPWRCVAKSFWNRHILILNLDSEQCSEVLTKRFVTTNSRTLWTFHIQRLFHIQIFFCILETFWIHRNSSHDVIMKLNIHYELHTEFLLLLSQNLKTCTDLHRSHPMRLLGLRQSLFVAHLNARLWSIDLKVALRYIYIIFKREKMPNPINSLTTWLST